jgi:hypothetical protein
LDPPSFSTLATPLALRRVQKEFSVVEADDQQIEICRPMNLKFFINVERELNSINPLLPKGGFTSPPSVFPGKIFLPSELCSTLLGIPKQMKSTHFAKNRMTVSPLGHVWSVPEHIEQISAKE